MMSTPSSVTRWPLLVRYGRPGSIAALYRINDVDRRVARWTANRDGATRFYSPEEIALAMEGVPQATWHTEEDRPNAS